LVSGSTRAKDTWRITQKRENLGEWDEWNGMILLKIHPYGYGNTPIRFVNDSIEKHPYANHGAGIFTNICPNKITQMSVNIPYMEHLGDG
jgi:hypothetical protein